MELLDRLEAAEKAVSESYQRGYATGKEATAPAWHEHHLAAIDYLKNVTETDYMEEPT